MTSRRADPSRLRHRRTSGSTGHPLFLPVTAAEERWKTWLWLKVYGRWGLRPWHRQAKLLHPSLQPRPRLPQRMGLYRRFYASTEASPGEKVDWLRAVRPDALFAWASLLGEMAIELERRGESVEVPLIFSTSDCLWPGLRDRVGRCLRGRLVDLYGAEETGPIAWECPADGGYHVCTGNVVLELLDDDGRPAVRGRVVCTVLWRRTVPLIRYDLGDLAEWAQEPCRCGSTLPRLARLHGREQDLVRMPDGRWISIGTFESVLYGLRGIRQFQLERTGPAGFTLRIVAGDGWGADEEREVLRRFHERFGDDLTLALLRCDEIARRPGEKFRPFIVAGT
jgi:phenylacetate-CoA ligase